MTTNTHGANDGLADGMVHFSNSQGTTSRGTLIHAGRAQVVFEVYNPYSIVQLSEVLRELRLHRRGRVIYQGRAMVSNLVSTGLMTLVSAALVDPWQDLSGLASPQSAAEEADRFLVEADAGDRLDDRFRLATGRLSGFLDDFHRWLDGTELTLSPTMVHGQKPSISRDLLEAIDARVGPRLDGLMLDFDAACAGIPPELANAYRTYAQRELHPLTLVSPWIHRCYSKPFGYAGDYEMLNMCLRDLYEGPTSYAKLLNKRILDQNPRRGYINRIDMLIARIRQEARRVAGTGSAPFRALSVGCGPANEVNRILREHPDFPGGCFDLMDFSPQTIDYCKARLAETCAATGRQVEAHFLIKSIHDLLLEARGRKEAPSSGYDLVYCAGLFDYLSDRICGSLTRLFYSWLRPGGMVVVTNVADNKPIQNVFELLLEWYLIYRDGPCMLKLTPGLGRQSIASDATGINIFLEVRHQP